MRGSKVSYHILSWYRQKPGNEIEFLVSQRDKSRLTYGEGVTERFIPEVEESANAFILTIGNADKNDDGLYYCAVWFSNQYIFGEGTEVKVQETQEIHRPILMIFEPSPSEIQSRHEATFLCYVERYFPKPLRIKWFLNNKSLPLELLTFQHIQNTDNTFHQTSVVTIPIKRWKKGTEVTCLMQHESGIQTRSIISTGQHDMSWEECDPLILIAEELSPTKNKTEEKTFVISPDSVNVLQVAFVTYSGLLCVSVSYGVLLSIFLIKRKLCKSKAVEETVINDCPRAE
ncbi:immunoglobulin kappa light chain-like [Rhinoderma darwinii]|uniref:immunoglobulin kappa light chain-like n=1 Tax=Rhinoderma darwinii TaxID=43563 RepID=UPI003F661B61